MISPLYRVALPVVCRWAFTVAIVAIVVAHTPVHAVTIDWVTVGDPGNAVDSTGYGRVDYQYDIGKYHVTIEQYCDFLNAVAKTDTYGLYDEGVNWAPVSGISRGGPLWTQPKSCSVLTCSTDGSHASGHSRSRRPQRNRRHQPHQRRRRRQRHRRHRHPRRKHRPHHRRHPRRAPRRRRSRTSARALPS